MQIGDTVISPLYEEKNVGKIISISYIGNERTFEVYFQDTKELLTLNEKNVEKLRDSIEKYNDRVFDNHLMFPIRLLAEKIDSLVFQNKIISAANFSLIPLPHQVIAVNKVLNQQFLPRCLIADEVGLGKTIEAGLIYEELKLRKLVNRILIVTPSNLTEQWKEEMETKFNEKFTIMNREVFKGLQESEGEEHVWDSQDKVICSIDFLKSQPIKDTLTNRMNELRNWHNQYITNACVNSEWDMVIIDEAHTLSKSSDGSETYRYKIGKQLADATPILLLLTATPHQGDSAKFRNLLRLIDSYKFYANDSITPENVESICVKNNKREAVDFDGNIIFNKRNVNLVKITRPEEDIESKLYEKVTNYVSEYYGLAQRERNFPFMFLLIIYQRMLTSSSRAIYNSLKKRLFLLENNIKSTKYLKKIDMSDMDEDNAQETYDKILKIQEEESEVRESGNYHITKAMNKELEILHECVNLANQAAYGRQDYKIKRLLEIIDEIKIEENNPDTKFLIFTEFIETQNYIASVLEHLGYSVTLFNGSMDLAQKIESKNRFKEECQFLVSTDSGGEGINLQFCHVLINYDLPWNPMKIEQRIGRIDRIGQKKDVKVYNFILEDTVEERVRDVLDSKLDLIAQEFGDDKKRDVLMAIQDENNFNKIYIEAISNNSGTRELNRISSSIYAQAKNILENQDFIIPITKQEDHEKVKTYMIDDEKELVENLVRYYLELNNVELIEYSKKRNVFYFEDYVDDLKLRNIVFDKNLVMENENYDYINIEHPFIKHILRKVLKEQSFAFDLTINGYSEEKKGVLFYYRSELTNNENFTKRELIPVFLNQQGQYDEKVSQWIASRYIFDFDVDDVDDRIIDVNQLVNKAEEVRNIKINDFKIDTEIALRTQLNQDKSKFEKYFLDKEKAIEKIAIENIRDHQIKDLYDLRKREFKKYDKRANLVPKVNLFAVAEVTLKH